MEEREEAAEGKGNQGNWRGGEEREGEGLISPFIVLCLWDLLKAKCGRNW